MVDLNAQKLSQLPDEMRLWSVASAIARSGPRIGALRLLGRTPIQTPNYVASASRGVIPHLTQDMQQKHSKIRAVYMGLEDFIERAPKEVPPLLKTPVENGQSPLRLFTAHDDKTSLILGLRRIPAVESPNQNTNSTIAVSTSVGFSQYGVEDYITAARTLKPDVIIGPGDVSFVPPKPSQRRVEKAADRAAYWMKELLVQKQQGHESGLQPTYEIFAPVIPVPWEQQRWYTELLLEDEFKHLIGGLAVYDVDNFHDPPKGLDGLPRLALTQPSSPAELLRQVWLGMDLFVIPFIGAATDAGIALDFSFPASAAVNGAHSSPLGIDCWDRSHATDLSPLRKDCQCYACQRHHRAYLQHLLHAKEMLGWVLLQVHNHHVMDEFFAGIRSSIEKGTFEQDMECFNRYFERDLPEKTGQGPRVRGYQRKSECAEPKMNPKAYNKLDDAAEVLAEADTPSSSADASELEDHGFGKAEKSSGV